MNDERMKSYLKGRLEDYRHPVDETLWSSLNESIPPKKRSLTLPFIAASIAAVVILIGLRFFLPSDSDKNEIADRPSKEVFPPAGDLSVTEKEPEGEQKKKSSFITSSGRTETAEDRSETSNEPFSIIEDDVQTQEQTPDESSMPVRMEPDKSLENRSYPFYAYEPPKRRRKNVAFNLGYNGGLNGSSLSDKDDELEFFPSEPIYGSDGKPIDWDNPVYDIPVSFSLSVRKGITKRFSLESGLTYTYLHTTDSHSEIDIKLHYLGIPVKGIYTFYDTRIISFYATAGGMVEKQVAGKLRDTGGGKSLVYSGLQWSVGTSAGLTFKLGNRMGLFAEPGINYFFDDNSNIPTIRKEKPLSFNLQIGLRFTID